MRGQVKDNNACNQIKGYGGETAKNPLFARLSEDFIKKPQWLMNSYEIMWFKSRFMEEFATLEYITVTKENIDQEHICCAISNNKDIQVSSKKDWMMQCFEYGLVFLKSTERGKCFIEYIPAENARVPILAENYMYIDCFWVSGALKGHGYSNDLLNACIKDSKEKGKSGLCVLSSAKKKPFLSDPKHLLYKGFQVADE